MKRIFLWCVSWLVLSATLIFSAPADATILVVSPHPDDDVIIAAGITHRARARGEPVIVVYVTNGDYDGLSTGYQRQTEAVAGQVTYLAGVEDNLIFLGYPDGYLSNIYWSYPLETDQFSTPIAQSRTYGNRGLGRSDYHTYKFGSSARYNLFNMVMDVRQIITDFRPDHILVTSEFDQHSDHAMTYQVVRLALEAVLANTPNYTPSVHKTIVHFAAGWPASMDASTYYTEPPGLNNTTLLWSDRESIDVPPAMQSLTYEQNPKYLAIAAYASQGGVATLGNRIHKDEFFWIDTSLGSTNHAPIASAGSDQGANQGGQVGLDGSGSRDPDGNSITFAWTQISGTQVQLSNAAVVNPTFTAPTGLAQGDQLVFQLVVSDGQTSSIADLVTVAVRPPTTCTNIAPLATVTASSETSQYGQTAAKAVDGVIDGWPGDYTREWAALGQGTGAWLNLAWNIPYSVTKVTLYDRPNWSDNIVAGTITFSDGTSIQVGPLSDGGAATEYTFAARSITGLTLAINQVSGSTSNVGLAEIQVCGIADTSGNHAPVANAGTDQPVAQGATVNLDGSGSRDPDGNSITFAWTQISGTQVQLSNAAVVNPTFTAPTGLAQGDQLVFQLVVSDGQLQSQADTVTITIQPPVITCTNIAPLATVTASSETSQYGQTAAKAVDGVIDGWPGDYTREWAALGQGTGAWLNLAWNIPYSVTKVTLYDRPNWSDNIVAGTITFSDGTSIQVGPLSDGGAATEYTFAARSITGLTLAINQVSGSTSNVGLAEIQVCGIADTSGNHAPVANAGTDQPVAQGATVNLDGSGSRDPDGNSITFAWTQISGTQVQLSNAAVVNPTFTAPTGLAQGDQLVFQLVVSDGQLQSQADTVTITIQPPVITCTNIAPLATVTASSETSQYGQTAAKAVDGVIDGWPGDYTREWAALGQGTGAWLNLAWNIPYSVTKVTLYDRPNWSDNIVAGTITFSDGTSIQVGPLSDGGAATEYTFAARSITGLTLAINQVSGSTSNVGLAEIQVCGVP